MDIYKIFNNTNETADKLWIVLNDVKKSSVVFLSMFDDEEDIDNNICTFDIALALSAYIDFNLIFKVGNKDFFNIKENEIIDIIKILHYLNSTYTIEILTLMKLNFPKLKPPYDDLKKMYNDIIIINSKMSCVANDCVETFKILKIKVRLTDIIRYKSENILKYLLENPNRVVISSESLLLASKNGYLNIVKYLMSEQVIKENISKFVF